VPSKKRTRRRITPYAEQAKLYQWFVVVQEESDPPRVMSGWEFREDALDAADDFGQGAHEGTTVKVVAKSRLARLGLEPEDATRGLTAHNFKIPRG
jgi:hypothetical protein